jgi:hypothetical protein
MKMNLRSICAFATATIAAPLLLNGCFVEVFDEEHDVSAHHRSTDPAEIPNKASLAQSTICDDARANDPRYQSKEYEMCFENEDYTWRVNCKSKDCQAVPVFVHYMLTEDLGQSNTVSIEAFDNPRYVGAPVSTIQVQNFMARQNGDYKQAELFLAPGTYYLRAFISNESELLVPYQYQGMELLSEKPIGIYGALSSPASVTVAPKKVSSFTQPVHITLDKLFKSKNEESDTKAYLRISFNTEENAVIPVSRKVLTQLRTEADLGMAPVVSFTTLTESFLIEGQKGKAELMTTSLPVGKYIVFSFLDANGNEFYDDGELAALHMKNAEAAQIDIRANRVESIVLTLKKDAQIPESVR